MTNETESLDPELDRLTEALRAGPNSPEWAVMTAGAGGTVEQQRELLIRTRERLEAGRAYREVRPGPGFTRKVMERVDADAAGRKAGTLSASYPAIAGAGLVVGGIILLALYLMHLGEAAHSPVDQPQQIFNTTSQAASFDGPLPDGWRLIGGAAVDPAKGLTPTTRAAASDYVGGGVISDRAVPADEPFAVEAVFQTQHLDAGAIPQLFVADSSDVSPDRGTASHELVCLVKNGSAQVGLPDGDVAGPTIRVDDGQRLTLRIVVTADGTATVLVNTKQLWSGKSKLPDGPRYVGVRVLRKAADKRDDVAVKFIKVMTR